MLGFVIAFLAFAFGGAVGLPPLVRLLVIAVGVVIAVLSTRMTGLGLAALVLGGIVIVSSISSLGASAYSALYRCLPLHPPLLRHHHRRRTAGTS